MFLQIIRSTQLDTPCLQQSRKKKTRYNCLLFEKKNTSRRVHRRFHEANIGQHCCGSMQTGATLLRYASPFTEQQKCWDLLGQKFDRFQTVRNKCQQLPTLLWFFSMQTDATSHNIVGPNNVGCYKPVSQSCAERTSRCFGGPHVP